MDTKPQFTTNIHWSEVRERFLRAKREGSWASQSTLDSYARTWKYNPDSGAEPGSWEGGSANQTEDWLVHGFFSEEFHHAIGQSHNIETTSIVWNEEEGDADIIRLICGYDEFFLGAVQAPSLSGIKILIDLNFNCNVEAKVIAEYGAFCANLINSLMESGFDVEIDWRMDTHGAYRGSYEGIVRNLVRVKEFGEVMDFTGFSALFAPTGMRHLNFVCAALCADRQGERLTIGLGRAIGKKWGIEWDENNRVITLTCDSTGNKFPGQELSTQAYEAGIM